MLLMDTTCVSGEGLLFWWRSIYFVGEDLFCAGEAYGQAALSQQPGKGLPVAADEHCEAVGSIDGGGDTAAGFETSGKFEGNSSSMRLIEWSSVTTGLGAWTVSTCVEFSNLPAPCRSYYSYSLHPVRSSC
jgi:hypothetical protein